MNCYCSSLIGYLNYGLSKGLLLGKVLTPRLTVRDREAESWVPVRVPCFLLLIPRSGIHFIVHHFHHFHKHLRSPQTPFVYQMPTFGSQKFTYRMTRTIKHPDETSLKTVKFAGKKMRLITIRNIYSVC